MLDPPDPATIVATIPRWLDRRPATGEAVLVGFTDNDPDLAVCLALHPEADPFDELNAVRQLVVDGAESVAILRTTGAEPAPGGGRLGLPFLTACAERYGLEVLGVLVVVPPQRDRPGYFRSLPDPARYPLPPSYARTEESQ